MSDGQQSPENDDLPPGPIRLGKFIERCRMDRGMRQADLARLAGVNASYLSTVEAGQRNWPQAVISRIAYVLGVHEAYFAYEAGIITEDPAKLADPIAFPKDDPRSDILAALPALSVEEAKHVRETIRWIKRGPPMD